MKRKLFLLVFLISFQIIYSQWSFQQANTTSTLNSVFFLNSQVGWIANDDGYILKTTNSGLEWISTLVDPGNAIYKVYFLNPDLGYAKSSDKLYKSTDGGYTWIIMDILNGYNFYFLDDNTSFILSGNKLLKTIDGWNSWREIVLDSTLTEYENISSIAFLDSAIGWATTSSIFQSGRVYRTTDCGESWQYLFSEIGNYHGLTSFHNSGILYMIRSVFLHSSSSSLYKSTNFGSEWFQLNVSIYPNYLFFVTPEIGYIIGDGGTIASNKRIMRTTDGGSSFQIEFSTTQFFLYDIFCVNDTLGWAVGSLGKILRRDNLPTGLNEELNQIEYKLYNNFPNPFNPATKIKYEVPQTDFVTLKIFDLLGREVATLVNEESPAGTYEIEFNPSNLSSGIYFYKISASEYSETKKMIYMK